LAQCFFYIGRVSAAGNRQQIPSDPLPVVSYEWFAGTWI